MDFLPRLTFAAPQSIARSYFLGHHLAGLRKMTSILSAIDLVVECRDYRVPVSSTNPLLESALAGRSRLVVFTKRDLGRPLLPSPTATALEARLAAHVAPATAHFSDCNNARDTSAVLREIKRLCAHAPQPDADGGPAGVGGRRSLTGAQVLVVGMPNVGKSTLLNTLRAAGVGGAKAARTGAQPGITRALATKVKIIDGEERDGVTGPGVYVLDSPGVFVPYVPDPETMLKLCLVGCVKDTVVPVETMVDYLLFRMNLHDPLVYRKWSEPTNDVMELLRAVATKTGKLAKGGLPRTEAAAQFLLQRWRSGELGHFVLDDVSDEGLAKSASDPLETPVSLNHAKKVAKEALRQRNKAKRERAAERDA